MKHKATVVISLIAERAFIRELHHRAVYFETWKRDDRHAIFEFIVESDGRDVLKAICETLDEAKWLGLDLPSVNIAIESIEEDDNEV